MEREYYFDEGLGESLEAHIAGIKKEFPDMTVNTRRDHDGLAIIHLVMKPKFKYNLDEIMSTGPEEFEKLEKDTLEAIYADSDPKSILAGDDSDPMDHNRKT
jgi:hypothetical protein